MVPSTSQHLYIVPRIQTSWLDLRHASMLANQIAV